MLEKVAIARTHISAELNTLLYMSGYKWFVKGNLTDFFQDGSTQIYNYDYIYFKNEKEAKEYCTAQNEKFPQLLIPTFVYKTEIAENFIDLTMNYHKQWQKHAK